MNFKEHWTIRFAAVVLLGFIIGNLLFLDYIILHDRKTNSAHLSTVSQTDDTENQCEGENCEAKLRDTIVRSLSQEREAAPTPIQYLESPSNEFSVSFGGGVVKSTEWQDVPGAAAYIDGDKYAEKRVVFFEAGVYIPTGNQTAYVRLFNETAEHPVWFSEVSLDGGEAQLLVSDPISLDPGNNLYQVQIKSSLVYDVHLTDSRVRIQTE